MTREWFVVLLSNTSIGSLCVSEIDQAHLLGNRLMISQDLSRTKLRLMGLANQKRKEKITYRTMSD